MADVDGLQKHMKGTTRANVEAALEPKELGVVEDAEQPEAIVEKSDSSGWLHLPTLEWLNSFIDNKGGARQIGFEDDSLSVLTGDTNIQATLKALDTYLNTLVTGATIVADIQTDFSGASDLSFIYKKFNNLIFAEITSLDENIVSSDPLYLTITMASGFTAIRPAATAIDFPVLIKVAGTEEFGWIRAGSGSNDWHLYREGGAFSTGQAILFQRTSFVYQI